MDAKKMLERITTKLRVEFATRDQGLCGHELQGSNFISNDRCDGVASEIVNMVLRDTAEILREGR